jgi:putative FmdB family regulatory protein
MIPNEGGMGMPTYDYKCTKCKRSYAVEQSILDAPLKKCKKCGGRLEKLLPRNVNLIFRGSGFYATDYRKGKASEPSSGSKRSTKHDKHTPKGGAR